MSARCVVTGAGGFLGSYLVKLLKKKGHWVRGVDLKKPLWSESPADDFKLLDLRNMGEAMMAVDGADWVFDLAADMGGMGFIENQNASNLLSNTLINTNVIEACRRNNVKRYFFSSSVCIYPIDQLAIPNPAQLVEEEAIPANPQGGYGWQKLTHEMRTLYYKKEFGLDTRIARFQNTYGPEGTYEGGREKAPAALCRKVAKAKEGDKVEVWGDGKAVRAITYVDDLIDGVYRLMRSDHDEPVNLGTYEQISIGELASLIIDISGKDLGLAFVDGPEGVRGRNFSHWKAEHFLGWSAKTKIKKGIKRTYNWINDQING